MSIKKKCLYNVEFVQSSVSYKNIYIFPTSSAEKLG